MKKRLISIVLTVVILFVTMVFPESPLQQTTLAFPGDEITSDGYTYIDEPGFREYNENDPNQYLLFSTAQTTDWLASGTNYMVLSPIGTASGTASRNGYIHFSNANSNTTGIHYNVIQRDGGNGATPSADQTLVMDAWGVDRMVYFYTSDSDMNAEGGTGVFDGVVDDGSSWHYYYNLKFRFPFAVDLTKYTHLYFDFWISGGYTKGTAGQLNVALWDNASGSEVDGFEYNIPFNKLKLDDDGKVNTGHTYRLDLRTWTESINNNGTHYLNSVDGVTFRYMTPRADKTQYNTGSTPQIYFGKMVAYTETDNWHIGYKWKNSAGTEYTTTNNPETQQATMLAITGLKRWNQSTKVVFPMWADFDGYRIIGLPWGDQRTDVTDYTIHWLDRYHWRWKRHAASAASHMGSFSFPASPYSGGGGAHSIDIRRQQSQWLSDTTHGSFVG